METNPKLGISEYDYQYMSCRCVYCNEVVILNLDTLEILVQEEVARLQAENVNNDFFFLTSMEEADIRKRLLERYQGSKLDYDQCIHDRCLAIIVKPENLQILNQIQLANRQNMVLPDACAYNIYPLNYTNVVECFNICAFCHRVISTHDPGFAYCLKSEGIKAQCLYLHTACYEGLLSIREARKEREKLVRRNFIHLLTAGQPLAWKNYSIEEIAARNDAWYNFLKQYTLTFDEREVLNDWLNFVREQKATWSEAQFIGRWLQSLKNDDLSLLVDDQLGGLTLDELMVLEGVIRTELDNVPIPTRCIPVPSNPALVGGFQLPPQNTVFCFGPPSPTMRQPPTLYLNLVQTLRQVKTPTVFYPAFSPIGRGLPV